MTNNLDDDARRRGHPLRSAPRWWPCAVVRRPAARPRRGPDPGEGHHRVVGRRARTRAPRARGDGLLVRLALGWSAPRQPVLGTECAGVVVAVGARGDALSLRRRGGGLPRRAMGAHAAYCVSARTGPSPPKPAGSRGRRPRRCSSAARRRSTTCTARRGEGRASACSCSGRRARSGSRRSSSRGHAGRRGDGPCAARPTRRW
jgi:hypothetical protein